MYMYMIHHAIENKANQKPGKLLCISHSYTQPSHPALNEYRIDRVDHSILYNMVLNS